MRKKLLTFLALLTVLFALPQSIKAWSLSEINCVTGYNIAKDANLTNLNWDTSNAITSFDGITDGRRYYFYSCVDGTAYLRLRAANQNCGYSSSSSDRIKGLGETFVFSIGDEFAVNNLEKGYKYYLDVYTWDNGSRWGVTAYKDNTYTPPTATPSAMYIYYANGSNPKQKAATFTKSGNVFTATNVNFDAAQWITFASIAKSESWDAVNAVRYVPNDGADINVSGSATSESTFKKGSDKGWNVPAGNYNITVDFDTKKVTFEIAKALTDIQIQKNGTGSWTSVYGSSNKYDVASTSTNDYFNFKLVYDSGTPDYLKSSSDITSVTSALTLTSGTSSSQTKFGHKVNSGKIYVTKDGDNFKLNFDNVVFNTISTVELWNGATPSVKVATLFGTGSAAYQYTWNGANCTGPFKVKAIWSDGSESWFKSSTANVSSNTNVTLTEGDGSAISFASNVDAANVAVTMGSDNYSVSQLNVTGVSTTSISTVTPAGKPTSLNAGTYTFSTTNSRGVVTYYGIDNNSDGNHTFSPKGTTETSVTVPAGRTAKVTWNGNVPQSIKIVDPNSVRYVLYGQVTNASTAEEMVLTYNAETDSWNGGFTSAAENMFVLRKYVGDTYTDYKGDYWFTVDNNSYKVPDNYSSGNNMKFSMGSNTKFSVKFTPTDESGFVGTLVIKKIFPPVTTVEIWKTENSGTKLGTFKKNQDGSFTWYGFVNKADTQNNWDERIYLKATADGTNWTTYAMSLYKDNTTGFPAGQWGDLEKDVDYFRLNQGDCDVRITVKVNPDKQEELKEFIYSTGGLNFYPRDVRKANGNLSAWTNPVVFVKGAKINANRIAPDWEMERRSDGKYYLDNVTLRGNDIKAVKISKGAAGLEFYGSSVESSAITPPDVETGEGAYGKTYNLVYDPSTNTLRATKENDLPPFVAIFGSLFVQEDPDYLPNYYSESKYSSTDYRGHTDIGWQDSWILYENDYPLRDLGKNYFYSSQWPPMSEIYFRGNMHPEKAASELTDDDYMGFKSGQLVMERDADGRQSGSAWRTKLTAAEYEGEYNNLFTTPTALINKYANDDRFKNKSNKWVTTLDDSKNYARYHVDNVWMLGACKIVTGWSTKATDDGKMAEWTYHHNWGLDGAGTDTHTDGWDILTNVGYQMKTSKGNFRFENPTYYKSIDFFIPVNDNGSIDADNAVVYTIQSFGNPSIHAQATKLEGTERENNTGMYLPTINDMPVDYYVSDYTIYRYDATSATGTDYKQWTPRGTENDPDNNIVITEKLGTGRFSAAGSNIYQTVFEPNIVDGKDTRNHIKETDTLEDGRYVYVVEITMKHNTSQEANATKVVAAVSNPFVISHEEFEPVVRPVQLLKLTDTGKAKVASISSDADFVTYGNDLGKSYVVTTDGKVVEITNKAILTDPTTGIYNNPADFWWTSNYYVYTFDKNAYDSKLSSNKEAVRYDDPTITVRRVTSEGVVVTDTDNVESKTAVVSDNGIMGAVFTKTDGNLGKAWFRAELNYAYYDEFDVKHGYYDDPRTATGWKSPVVPMPWGYYYAYNYNNERSSWTRPAGEDYDWIKLHVTSGYDLINGVETPRVQDVLISVDELQPDANNNTNGPRQLDCEFRFHRPNVCSEILSYYDIDYTLRVENNLGEVLINDEVFYDDTVDRTKPEDEIYWITVKNVHPSSTIYPILKIDKVEYKKNDAGTTDPQIKEDAVATGDPVVIEAKYATKKVSWDDPTIYLNYAQDGKGKYNWIYHGHNEFADPGDHINDQPDKNPMDLTPETVTLSDPMFYLVETVSKDQSEYAAYDFVYRHPNGHHDNGWTAEKNDYGRITNDPDDKMIGTTIAKGFTTDIVPTLYFTPVYVFFRDAQVVGNVEDKVNTILKPRTPKNGTASYTGKVMRSTLADNESNNLEINSGASMPNVGESAKLASDKVKDINDIADLVSVQGGESSTSTKLGEPDDNITTGIGNVLYDAESGEAVYYNLQGIRVANPEAGQVYVVRRGSVVTKELLK